MSICEKSVLQHIVERVGFSKLIDKIIVATSKNHENDAIEMLCKKINIDCFRGSENNVLSRFQEAVKYYNIQDGDLIVRICCDCPLVCPDLIDMIILHHGDNDLTTNCIKRTYPDGLDVEVFKAGLLNHPDFNNINFFEKEYSEMNFKGFKITNIVQEEDLSSLRWTLDTQRDYEYITKIYEALYKPRQIFLMEDVLNEVDSRHGKLGKKVRTAKLSSP